MEDPFNKYFPIEEFIDTNENILICCRNDRIVNEDDATAICIVCGDLQYILVESPILQNGYAPKKHIYKKLNHLTKFLNKYSANFSIEEKEQISALFSATLSTYHKYKGLRKNFISYSYFLYKICQILKNKKEKLFRLLKNKEKVKECDVIWKNICDDLKWKYYET